MWKSDCYHILYSVWCAKLYCTNDDQALLWIILIITASHSYVVKAPSFPKDSAVSDSSRNSRSEDSDSEDCKALWRICNGWWYNAWLRSSLFCSSFCFCLPQQRFYWAPVAMVSFSLLLPLVEQHTYSRRLSSYIIITLSGGNPQKNTLYIENVHQP